jgi:hypothetical protein
MKRDWLIFMFVIIPVTIACTGCAAVLIYKIYQLPEPNQRWGLEDYEYFMLGALVIIGIAGHSFYKRTKGDDEACEPLTNMIMWILALISETGLVYITYRLWADYIYLRDGVWLLG